MTQDRSGPFTPKCLYLIAQIHHYLYQFHKTDGDAQAAIRHYRLLIQEYPHSNLADDAQFMLGIFYLEELHQPAQAYSEFLKVGIHFPTGTWPLEPTRSWLNWKASTVVVLPI